MLEGIWLILRMLFLGISFAGLCGGIRHLLKMDRFIAPFFAASGIIVVLMLAGMLNALAIGFYALYGLGFVSFFYVYLVRKEKPDYALIAACGLFLLFLVWQFSQTTLVKNDDLSHWGLVARYLLRTDALPDASMHTILFQSYPVGSAAFIYYACRTLISSEGAWLIAQEFLGALAFLPLLAHAEKNRGWLYPAAALLFFLFGLLFREPGSMHVDELIGYYGIGIVASACRYRQSPGKAIAAVCLAVPAVVYIKSSGLFMAAVGAVTLAFVVSAQKKDKRLGLLTFVACLAAAIGAYGLWTLHVREAFPVGMQTKHAVSLSKYAAQLKNLDWRLIKTIVKKMLLRILRPGLPQWMGFLYVCGCGAICGVIARKRPEYRPAARRAARLLVGAVCAYAAWEAMLFLMYVFSMPETEAARLASYGRYVQTSTILMMGMATVAAAGLVNGMKPEDLPPARLGVAIGAVVLACAVIVSYFGLNSRFWQVFGREKGYVRQRVSIQRAQEELGFADGGTFLFFWTDRENKLPSYTLYYFAKYEYDAPNIDIIIKQDDEAGGDYLLTSVREGSVKNDGTGHYAVIRTKRDEPVDPLRFLAEHLDEYDALIVADEDPAFDADVTSFLADYAGSTPVWYSYK